MDRRMSQALDRWLTTPPDEDWDDEICFTCNLDFSQVEENEFMFDGYCCEECSNDTGHTRFVRPMMNLFTKLIGEYNFELLAKRVYRDTKYGVRLEDTGYDRIRFQTIVEGTDIEIVGNDLVWPFTEEDFWNALQEVEELADEAWNDWKSQGEDGDYECI